MIGIRGIMLLEVAMEVIANNALKARLMTISDTLPHEMQNGFRPGRGCSVGSRSAFCISCGRVSEMATRR
jgi:hypothetical protein